MTKPMSVQEAGRLGGKKAAEKRPKETYSQMANIRWHKKEVAAEA